MRTVYLCGGINGLSDDMCNNWRDRATERLVETFDVLNPMRRDYRGKEDGATKEIVEGDYEDIDNSDIVLVNASRPSWGTAMEMHQSYQAGKKVVTVCNIAGISPWVKYHSHIIFADLDAAISYILTLS
jgi:hypothetical protein